MDVGRQKRWGEGRTRGKWTKMGVLGEEERKEREKQIGQEGYLKLENSVFIPMGCGIHG